MAAYTSRGVTMSEFIQDDNNYVRLRGTVSNFDPKDATYNGGIYITGTINTKDGKFPLLVFTKCRHVGETLCRISGEDQEIIVQGKLTRYKSKFHIVVFWVQCGN